MRGKLRRIVTVLLLIVLVGSLGAIGWQQINYRKGDTDYADAAELVGIPEELPAVLPAPEKPETPTEEPRKEPAAEPAEPAAPEPDPLKETLEALEAMDLDILRSVNGDVVGWIVIPGTKVNYPVLQKNDNDYYLTRTWKGESSSVGSIFVDYRNTPGFGDDNTLIYGHNMRNGSMFGGLKYYINDGHWEAHPSIYLVDDAGVHRYDIYAVYEARVDAVTYEMNFADDQAKTDFIHYGIRRSVVDTDIVPAAEDRIITLSTCTGMGYTTRWVVQAVLADA